MEVVQQRYLDSCSKLGWSWKGEVPNSDVPLAGPIKDDGDVPIDWDAPYDPIKDPHRHKGSSMGVSVSVLNPSSELEDTTTLHGLCVSGDADKLRTLLELDKDIDINALDEFVSRPLLGNRCWGIAKRIHSAGLYWPSFGSRQGKSLGCEASN
jgi:hypothetical protein